MGGGGSSFLKSISANVDNGSIFSLCFRSVYREFLFLKIAALGRDRVDIGKKLEGDGQRG